MVPYKTSGEVVDLMRLSDHLEQLQKEVGGYIELIEFRHDGLPHHAIVNEEGLLRGLAPNPGVLEAYPALQVYRRLVGDVVILSGEDLLQ